jgi:DNA-binding transcriptional MocR family regulator
LSFAQAVPAPESYPIAELGKALRASVYDPQTLGYGSFQGDPILREQVANIAAERGIHASPDDVLIVNGAQQGIDVALRAFTTVDEPILVETPSYPGMLEVAATRGQPVIAIPRDADGPSISAIEAACGSYHPGFLYLVPTYHNPTGRSTTPERRTEIKRVARARDLIVVEDDPYGLLALDEPAALALASGDEEGRVVYITSFSKTLLPGLRLGAMIAAPERLPPLLAVKRTSDLTCSPILQCALADYLRHGYFDAHLKRVRVLYRERRDVMLGALSRHLPGCRWLEPAGGLGVWVELPEGVNERDLYLAAIEAGVGVARGQAFFPQPVQTAYVRLSYGNHNPEEIERGVSILGTVLREHLRQSKELVTRARREASPLV